MQAIATTWATCSPVIACRRLAWTLSCKTASGRPWANRARVRRTVLEYTSNIPHSCVRSSFAHYQDKTGAGTDTGVVLAPIDERVQLGVFVAGQGKRKGSVWQGNLLL